MKVINLGSGSKGNATLVKIPSGYILIDCGLKKFKEKLNELNITLDEIKYVFITHNHIDHILNINLFDSDIIYAAENTIEVNHNVLDFYKTYDFDEFSVTTLKTSHDAPDSVAYIFNIGNSELAYLTDSGKIPAKTERLLKNRRFYILESNYEYELLKNSGRPLWLIKRIDSSKGHLSNLQCRTYLEEFMSDNTLGFALAHISEDCNNDSKIAANLNYFNKNIKIALKQWEPTFIEYDED